MHRIADTPDPWPLINARVACPQTSSSNTWPRSGHGTHAAFGATLEGSCATRQLPSSFGPRGSLVRPPQSSTPAAQKSERLPSLDQRMSTARSSRRGSQPIHPLSLDKERAIPRQGTFPADGFDPMSNDGWRKTGVLRCRRQPRETQPSCPHESNQSRREADSASANRLITRLSYWVTRHSGRPREAKPISCKVQCSGRRTPPGLGDARPGCIARISTKLGRLPSRPFESAGM